MRIKIFRQQTASQLVLLPSMAGNRKLGQTTPQAYGYKARGGGRVGVGPKASVS